ncbi:uncharacterized protein TNCV_2558961 [Trichonephila clavipes]|nr:uncharacterized protein TNCV_2558961 [Trichonephila clavipes]
MAPRRKTNLSRRSRHAEQEKTRLSNMTEEERISQSRSAADLVRYQRNGCERVRIAGTRTQRTADLNLQYHRLAFQYNPAIDYSSSRNVVIGQMSHVCTYCQALKFNNETKGMCCAGGKIKLPHLEAPPEPLKTLLAGSTAESKLFLSKHVMPIHLRLSGSNNSCISSQAGLHVKVINKSGRP